MEMRTVRLLDSCLDLTSSRLVMLAFIDESGCAGFKFSRGSTPYFVVSMVIFHDHDVATRADEVIGGLRIPLGHSSEFKFSKCRPEVRDGFFQAISSLDFVVRAIVVDKAKLYSLYLRARQPFYNYFVQTMMQHDGGILTNATVKIDGSGDRQFKQELQKYLKQQLKGRVRKIRLVNSRTNNLIQLADMAAGAIHRNHRDDRVDRSRWFDMLLPRIDDVWTFPNPGH